MCCNKEEFNSLHIKVAEEIQLGHVSGNYHFKSDVQVSNLTSVGRQEWKCHSNPRVGWRRKFSDTCMTHKLHTYSLQRVLQLVVVSLVSMRRILRSHGQTCSFCFSFCQFQFTFSRGLRGVTAFSFKSCNLPVSSVETASCGSPCQNLQDWGRRSGGLEVDRAGWPTRLRGLPSTGASETRSA